MAESTYEQATASMREVVKWLVTVVPGAGSVLVVTQIVPGWSTRSLSGGQALAVAALAVVAAVAVVVTVRAAFAVLRPHLSGWGELLVLAESETLEGRTTEPGSVVHEIDSSGILNLHGYDSLASLSSTLLEGTVNDDARHAADEAIHFADHLGVRKAFSGFLITCGIAATVIVACFAATLTILASVPEPIEGQVSVTIEPTASGREQLAARGCDLSQDLTGVAVGGSWSKPQVILSSNGCAGVSMTLDAAIGSVWPTE